MIFWTLKYTNTDMAKCHKYLTYAIFFHSWWFKDVKNYNPKCSDQRSESILIRSGTQEYRHTDFCTVPQGLFLVEVNCKNSCIEIRREESILHALYISVQGDGTGAEEQIIVKFFSGKGGLY